MRERKGGKGKEKVLKCSAINHLCCIAAVDHQFGERGGGRKGIKRKDRRAFPIRPSICAGPIIRGGRETRKKEKRDGYA